jgi:hypothetical protein
LISRVKVRQGGGRHLSPRAFAFWALAITALLACLAVAIGLLAGKVPPPRSRSQPSPANARRVPRPIYRHSVVPGGVYTREELSEATSRDRIVAAHYAGFNIGKARPLALDHDRRSYVSFRLGDKIYWTRDPVLINRAETVLTDGHTFVRARCGNQIADLPAARPRNPT